MVGNSLRTFRWFLRSKRAKIFYWDFGTMETEMGIKFVRLFHRASHSMLNPRNLISFLHFSQLEISLRLRWWIKMWNCAGNFVVRTRPFKCKLFHAQDFNKRCNSLMRIVRVFFNWVKKLLSGKRTFYHFGFLFTCVTIYHAHFKTDASF